MNPDGRTMRRFERELKATTLSALQRLRDDLFDGVTEATVMTATARLDDPRVLNPFRDRIVAQLQRIAIAGAEFGREQVERHVFGVKVGDWPRFVRMVENLGIDTESVLYVESVKQGNPLDIDWQLANNDAAEWALRYGYDLVRGINSTTRRRLQVEIANFIQNGETLGELTARLEDLFGPVRAETIAVTEVTRSFYEGNKASWKESGVIQGKEWMTANDEIVAACPICFPMHGQVVPLDEPWQHPTRGAIELPGHPRCRCVSLPVPIIEGETEQ